MVCFVNVQSGDRVIYALFDRFQPQWKNRTLQLYTSIWTLPKSELCLTEQKLFPKILLRFVCDKAMSEMPE